MTEEQFKKVLESFDGTDAIGAAICVVVRKEDNTIGLQHVVNLPSMGAGMGEADALEAYTSLQQAMLAGIAKGLKAQVTDRVRELFATKEKGEDSAGDVTAE